MTPTRKREIQSYLTGRIPLDLRGKKIDPPSDMEIKDWLCNAPNELVHLIGRGPNGDTFRKNANAAMARITEKEMEGRPIPNGRVASAFMDFDENEVGLDTRPINPDKK
jgi:hypothetical protein